MKIKINSSIIWTILIGVLGIIVTIILYEIGKINSEPVWTITKEPSLVFDSELSSSKIVLLSADSSKIENNVYITTLQIWNNGRKTIERKDVRKDINIKLLEGDKIIDFKLTNQTHPEIAKFKIIPQSNSLVVDWDYFDPGFGLELQILYSGSKNSKTQVTGYVLGGEIKEVSIRRKYPINGLIAWPIVIIIFTIMAFLTLYLYRKTDRELKFRYIYILIGLVLIAVIVYSGLALYSRYFMTYKAPF